MFFSSFLGFALFVGLMLSNSLVEELFAELFDLLLLFIVDLRRILNSIVFEIRVN